jgi:hypothetical protein
MKAKFLTIVRPHVWMQQETAAGTVTCAPRAIASDDKLHVQESCFAALTNGCCVGASAPTGSSLLADLDHNNTLRILETH